MALRHDRQHMKRKKQSAVKTVFAGRHERDINVAALQAARQARASVLNQMDLNAGVAFAVARQKICQQALDGLRCGANP